MLGTVLVLGHRISGYYVLPFVLVSLTLPAFTLSTLQDPVARSFNWIELALAPVFIVHPLIVIAVTGGFFLAGGAVERGHHARHRRRGVLGGDHRPDDRARPPARPRGAAGAAAL